MIVLNSFPKIDVHGETSDTVVAVVNSFINDNYKLKEKYIVIIHGKGSGILKNKVHELLKNNKLVDEYKLDVDNIGQTIIKLKENEC